MWEAIAYVSSGLTLVAFIVATVAWTYKSKSEERERLIRTAKAEQRYELVRNPLEFFNVDTSNLTKEQQYNIALKQVKLREQRYTITAIVVCFLAVTGALLTGYVIREHIIPPVPPGPGPQARFDVKFGQANFVKIGEQTRSEIILHALPLTIKNDEVATIFTGVLSVHNEEFVDLNRDTNHATCKETPSCLYSKVFNVFSQNPLIIRGGNPESVNITSLFDLPSNVKYIRVYWEFYQQEANNNNLCVIDSSKQFPVDGIPYLKVISKKGDETKEACWKASDTKNCTCKNLNFSRSYTVKFKYITLFIVLSIIFVKLPVTTNINTFNSASAVVYEGTVVREPASPSGGNGGSGGGSTGGSGTGGK